ncbi:MAG: TAXI family TRAP transporter solute-binding subunit [Rhodospirillales bacterium]
MSLSRRALVASAAGFGLAGGLLSSGRLAAEDRRYFRIAAGSSAGVYYPLAGLIAAAISNPGGRASCQIGGLCGVPGLIALAQSSGGSIDNLELLLSGRVESGLCQADIAQRAFVEGLSERAMPPAEDLRVLAHLYEEYLHVVVRADAGIRRMTDLAGKRLSVGPLGSGTRNDALILLAAAGLSAEELELLDLPSVAAAAALRAGELDGFLLISGAPANAVTSLADRHLVKLLPVEGDIAEAVLDQRPSLHRAAVEPGLYSGIGFTPTLATGALWLTTEALGAELAYRLTRALWSEATANFLAGSRLAPARQMSRAQALQGVGAPPLHPGAALYYDQVGLLEEST